MIALTAAENLDVFRAEVAAPRPDGRALNYPLMLDIEVTARCNYRCVHCFRSSLPPDQAFGELDPALFERLLPFIPAAHSVQLCGNGEVLLNIPRHLDMLRRLLSLMPDLRLGFSTNGLLLTPEVYETYARTGLAFIQFSIDAADPELYGAMRRGGDLARIRANLEGIRQARAVVNPEFPTLQLSTVVSRQNLRELPALADLAAEFCFAYWYISPEIPINVGRDRLRLTASDLSAIGRMRPEILRRAGRTIVRFDPSMEPGTLADRLRGLARRLAHRKVPSRVHCTVPWNRLQVLTDGGIKVCPFLHLPLCSLADRTIEEVWNGIEYANLRRAMVSRKNMPDHCARCRDGLRWSFLHPVD